ncbi:MAG: hypothetical protein IPJ05_02655 [Nitrosomonas sp.]|nr:hypothetical protein [Nitrosomonas sp.]
MCATPNTIRNVYLSSIKADSWVALPQPKYGLLDPAGAKEAGRRRGVLKGMIENLAGQVQTIEVMDVIGSRGKLMGVDETVAKAQQAALPVTLSDEAKALLAAKQAEIENARRRINREQQKNGRACSQTLGNSRRSGRRHLAC